MVQKIQKDTELDKKRELLSKDPVTLSLFSRHPLHIVFLSLLALLVVVDLIAVTLWATLVQDDITQRSRERSIKISRSVTSELNTISQNIVRAMEKANLQEDLDRTTAAREFSDITKDLEGDLDIHLFDLDSHNVIQQVSRSADKKWVGKIFDEGSRIPFSSVRPGLLISEMLPSLDSQTPLFEWRKKRRSGSYVLQIALSDFGDWCKQVSFAEKQDVFLSIASSGNNYLRHDCVSHRDFQDLWGTFQDITRKDPTQTIIPFGNHDYVVSIHRPETFPLIVTVFVKLPNKTDLYSENSGLFYALLLFPFLLFLMIFTLFKIRIAEQVHRIQWITQALQNHLGKAVSYPKYSPEFAPAFADLRTMYDALGNSHAKNSIKTKLATELGSFYQADDLIGKATELIGIQSRSESSFFIPSNATVNKSSLKGWSWTRHTMKEMPPNEQDQIRWEINSRNPFRIPVTSGSQMLGEFFLLGPKLPEKTIVEIAPTLVSIIKSTLARNKAHRREAIKELELMTVKSLQTIRTSPWKINKSSYEIASFYKAPAKHSGEFLYQISSEHSDDFFFIIGGPSSLVKSYPLDDSDQLIVPPISWTIKGIIDGFRQLFEASGNSADIKPSQVIQAIYHTVQEIAPKEVDAWSFFACKYVKETSELVFSNAKRKDPIFIRKNDATTEQLVKNIESRSTHDADDHLGGTQDLIDRKVEIKHGDVLLLLVGNASVCTNDRHQIFHNILFRRLANFDPKLSATEIRDTISAFQAYYYQEQPLDKDLCVLVFQRYPENEQLEKIAKTSPLAS